MRHYLVVAHRTLDSPELLDMVRDRASRGPATFHLVVPDEHQGGFLWDEGAVRQEASQALESARTRLLGLGFAVDGEVGRTNPVQAVDHVLRRDPDGTYDEIIVSTLPSRISRWMGFDAPARIARATTVPVTHVESVGVTV
ncbi:MAG: hypothetical protein ACYC2O_03070 [Microthrixaceae bacterium]